MKSLALLVGGLGVVVEGSSGDNYLGGARDLVYDSERELVLIAAIHGKGNVPPSPYSPLFEVLILICTPRPLPLYNLVRMQVR